MDLNGTIASCKGMNDLYQKINKYAYEIRMMELDEYLYGMNRKKIHKEKAYDIIIDAPDSESNPVTNFWKARLADPYFQRHRSIRVVKNKSRASALYEKAVYSNIEGMAENGDRYACVCLGWMYGHGLGVTKNNSTAVEWYRKAAEQGHADAQLILGKMYKNGWGVAENNSTAAK